MIPYLDRQNLGLSNSDYLRTLYKWKIIDAFYVALVFVASALVHLSAPYQRQFTINDLTISHPFAEHERVPPQMLLELVAVVPLVIFLVVDLILTPSKRKVYLLYISFLGLAISVTTCDLIVGILKNWVGRCRPDFLARCIPKADALPDTLYFAKDVCTTTDMGRLLDGFRTTPSGHSSMAFSSFGYVTFWLLGQFLGCSCNYVGAWRFLVSGLPSLFAAYVALSRTQDYRHHFVDVVLGSAIGWLFAWWAYRRYFPSVFHKYSYVPSLLLDTAEKGPDDYKTHDFYAEEDGNDWQHGDIENQSEVTPLS
ncbi:DEKNAAC105222 [Brettanomyces naardenensis]|uniref:DEKNAAC105222 n=1 Tax=Brettanomyces naardenensis TaxID=13370 RepID=A0A448YSY8_BRENA|nr:DEKNAAC105222 [Brettanomyces naardenensis]